MASILFIGSIIVLLLITSSLGVEHILGDSVISTISVGVFPQALIFNPYNNNIYVANRDSGTVSVIDTQTIL